MKRSSGSSISLVLCLAAAVAVLPGCGTSQQPTGAPAGAPAGAASPAAAPAAGQDEAAIRAAGQAWGLAIQRKDLDQTVSLYADDAWVYPQGAPIAKTAEQRRAVWAAFFAIPAFNMAGETERIVVSRSGDLAMESGIFSMTVNDSQGRPVTQTEKYVVTWKKQADGNWKVIADIWNTDH